MLVTPDRKHLTFALGSSVCRGDPHDVLHAKHPELANLTGGLILVDESTAYELVIFHAWRVGEHRDLRRDAPLYKVGSFERASTAGIKGNDDNVGRRDRITCNEGPSRGPQDGFTYGGNTGDDSRSQRDHCHNPGPSWPTKLHV